MARKRNNTREIACLRSVDFQPIETRDGDSGDGSTLFGYAAVFDVDTEINSWEGTFTERMAFGAFKKTLRDRTPVCQFDHGYDQRTGTVPIGVFTTLAEEPKGLRVEASLFDNDVVLPIRQAIAAGAISGMSIRFNVVRDEWRDKDGKKIKPEELWDLLWSPGERGPLSRTIKEVKLSEAGPVVFPAYTATSVGVRGEAPDDIATLPEDERRQIVTDTYLRRMSNGQSPADTTDAESPELTSVTASEDTDEDVPSTEDNTDDNPDAVRENTSGEDNEEDPTDAVRENTSKGSTTEVPQRVIPARVVRARHIPTRIPERTS